MTATQTREPAGSAPTTVGSLPLRIGSLCTGYGGLDMAVQQVFGGEVSWVADPDPGAAAILAHHHPDVPNHGDIKLVDWSKVGAVDIVTGGYPCQPFSNAGLRLGVEDERHIWPYIVPALRVLRPRYAVFENVANHLRIGFDVVLADLAALGFDVEWCTVRASEVGAPHGRPRLIFLATAAEAPHLGHERGRSARGRRPGSADRDLTPADAGGIVSRDDSQLPTGRGAVQQRLRDDAPRCGSAAANADSNALRQQPVPQSGRSGSAIPGQPGIEWGAYEPAIRRWEHATGRSAPRPTEPGRTGKRLAPRFVEWLMGLPAGHVTDVPGLSRNQQLKALGNGVVPQQLAAAIGHLFSRIEVPA